MSSDRGASSDGGKVLEGYVTRCDPGGWLELTLFRFNTPTPVEQNVLVYIFELQRPGGSSSSSSSCFNESLLNSFVVVTGVHPIYLWNSLAGFTTGIGSTISQSPHLRLKKRSRSQARGGGPSCGGLSVSGALCSNKCVLFLLWQAVACGRVRSAVHTVSSQSRGQETGQGQGQALVLTEETLSEVLLTLLPPDLSPFEATTDVTIDTESDFLFYVVRARNDTDWLCSMLPEILNTRHILKLAQKLCKKGNQQWSLDTRGSMSGQAGAGAGGGYRAYVGLCGRGHKALGLSFSACVVGSVACLDLGAGALTLADSSGAAVKAFVDGGLREALRGAMRGTGLEGLEGLEDGDTPPPGLMAVILQPCLLVEDAGGTLPTTILVANVSRLRLVYIGTTSSTTSRSSGVGNGSNTNNLDVAAATATAATATATAATAATATATTATTATATTTGPCLPPPRVGRERVAGVSVRRALTLNPKEMPWWTSDVTGVVVFKEAVNSGWSYGGAGAGAGAGAVSGPPPSQGGKCSLMLRDTAYADKISAFVEASCVAGIAIGTIICVRRCTIRINKSQKNVYIDFDRKRGSCIGM
jgi:hypothetical protein